MPSTTLRTSGLPSRVLVWPSNSGSGTYMTNQAVDIWEAAYVLDSNAMRLADMSPAAY